uniref:Uncharacterized protein n=1 Tax=Tetranychus urticae TaxID=32264 RepID=T1KRH7_TETUR
MGSSNLTSTDADRARPTMAESLTAIFAASSRSSQANILKDEAAIRALASSTRVPWSRTTIGILRAKVFAAMIIPSAIMSHLIIPPKMFTRIAWTLESDEISLKASVTCSAVAPPPTSRKFAGLPP